MLAHSSKMPNLSDWETPKCLQTACQELLWIWDLSPHTVRLFGKAQDATYQAQQLDNILT